jgi:cell division protein ZapA
MAQISIEIGGRRYEVNCRDGGEARLRMLAGLVDARAADVIRSVGRGNETRELVLTALLLADDLDEARGAAAALDAHADALERCAARIEALADGTDAPEA